MCGDELDDYINVIIKINGYFFFFYISQVEYKIGYLKIDYKNE